MLNTDVNGTQEETLEETGWKLVHGDVFRPPKHTKLLASLVGSGLQIFCMALITIGKRLGTGCRILTEDFQLIPNS